MLPLEAQAALRKHNHALAILQYKHSVQRLLGLHIGTQLHCLRLNTKELILWQNDLLELHNEV